LSWPSSVRRKTSPNTTRRTASNWAAANLAARSSPNARAREPPRSARGSPAAAPEARDCLILQHNLATAPTAVAFGHTFACALGLSALALDPALLYPRKGTP
jgi:hypothetical protein